MGIEVVMLSKTDKLNKSYFTIDQKLTFSKILKIDQSETELLVAVMFVNSFDRNE
jgi:hypothetical protein